MPSWDDPPPEYDLARLPDGSVVSIPRWSPTYPSFADGNYVFMNGPAWGWKDRQRGPTNPLPDAPRWEKAER